MNLLKLSILILGLLSLPFQGSCQPKTFALENSFNESEKKLVIAHLTETLRQKYIFPQTADSIATQLQKTLTAGKYTDINDRAGFAAAVTADLQTMGRDKHLRLKFSTRPIAKMAESDLMSIPAEKKQAYATDLKNSNYGINKIDVLAGNIGYLSFGFFCAPEFAGDTYAAAMNFLAHTDALIIDLRKCRGSASPDAIPFLCSYFFQTPVHLNDLQWRAENRVDQAWTYAYVPGKKFVDKPIYILTSFATFSGAEEIAYDLKVLKRARIIGAVTAGGANPGGDIRLTENFSVFMPVGRAVNPITKTNWESVGVQPDSAVSFSQTLATAHLMALDSIANHTTDTGRKHEIERVSGSIRSALKPTAAVNFYLKGFENAREVYVTGNFNDWTPKAHLMRKVNNGWILNTPVEQGQVVYQFIVDGKWILDPANKKLADHTGNRGSVLINE